MKQIDLVKVRTQQDILLMMTFDFNIEKKSLVWLTKFKSNLEKYFEKEVTLIQIIKRRIQIVEKGMTKQEEEEYIKRI